MELDWPAWRSERETQLSTGPLKGKGRAWGPCMRIRTLVTPICSCIPLSLPHRCHGDMSGITVSLIPQRKQYSVWTLSVGLWGSQSAGPSPTIRASYKRQHFTRGSAALPIIDLSPFYPLALPTCLFLEVPPQPQCCWSPPEREVNWCGRLHPPASRPLSPQSIVLLSFLCLLVAAVDSPGWAVGAKWN